jgi:ATP-binding cassette, subfamily B, bacterial
MGVAVEWLMVHGNNRRVFAGLWQAVWRYRGRTLLAIALLVLAKIAAVGVPLLLKEIVDRFSQPASMAADMGPAAAITMPSVHTVLVLPVFLLLGYALLRFSGTLFTELRDLAFARVTKQTVSSFAEKVFAHLLSLNPRFHVQRSTGSLIRDVDRGTVGVGFLLGAGVFTVVPTLVEFIAVLGVMALGYSLWFTLVILVTFFVYAAFTILMTQRREVRQRRVNDLDSSATGRMVDSLINYETVKTYAREAFERERYAAMLDNWVEQSVRNQTALSLLHVGQSAIIACGVAAVMLLAGDQTVRGTMTVGDLVLVNSYVIQICMPLNALGFVFREAKDALVNTEKLFALLDQRPEIEDAPDSAPLVVTGGEVAFEHVGFAYEPGRQILQDVSFTVPAGKTVAVVGGSGSGKSTLARLLLRMYDVQAGRIAVDGQDLRDLTLASLRESIGVVPQDTVLFNETIAYNIGYGRTTGNLAEVIEAARAAQVHEFIASLPAGYDTVVGERGLKLSGGEKQRIAIARAFLKNPPMMIFDEATSALDTRAERAIQGELDRIARGRSTLIIAHRLSTIVNADQIIVMDQGRIVEQGRHDELLAREGLYAQLWNLQRQQAQLDRLQRDLARQPVNLTVLVAGVIDGLRGPIGARGVGLFTDIDLEHARVLGDPSLLSQAVRELMLAALQATSRGGRIELRVTSREGRACVSITDGRHTGASATAARGDGEAADDARSSPFDPLELRSVIERQGGRFTMEPPLSTRGLRYAMELPLRELNAGALTSPASAPHADTAPALALRGLQVLCVEDRADMLQALRDVLEQEGAQVLPFASGRGALGWLESHDDHAWPQAVVCDLSLADEDGNQLMRRIRQIEAKRGLPLERRVPSVALAGLARESDRMRALMSGFQEHLAKPVNPRELVSAVYRLSGRALESGGTAPPLPLARRT